MTDPKQPAPKASADVDTPEKMLEACLAICKQHGARGSVSHMRRLRARIPAAQPERAQGVAAIFGKWPGDETDEQIMAELDPPAEQPAAERPSVHDNPYGWQHPLARAWSEGVEWAQARAAQPAAAAERAGLVEEITLAIGDDGLCLHRPEPTPGEYRALLRKCHAALSAGSAASPSDDVDWQEWLTGLIEASEILTEVGTEEACMARDVLRDIEDFCESRLATTRSSGEASPKGEVE
jgi:hypothetical protein